MTTIASYCGKAIAFTKGSPEHIMEMCLMTNEYRHTVENLIVSAQEKAMRVIAFAHKQVDESTDYSIPVNHREMESMMVFDGFVAISDPLRKEVYDAVGACKKAGISLKILTGDNIVTAKSIANELEILNGMEAVEAKDIESLTDEKLLTRLHKICVIARSTPAIKLRIVRLLKSQGNVVAVTGDGINDAPALKNADVGIAMGITGTEVSKEASEIVLLDDSFATIVKAIEWGRNIYENFKRFISFQLTVNVASVIVVFFSVLMGLDAPFTALELLVINIIMDGPPALTLGLEPNYDDLMNRRPTGRNENIISKSMLVRIFTTGILVSMIFLVQYKVNFLAISQKELSTSLFAMFVLFQLFNAFNCRELHSQSIFKHLLKNKIMLIVIAITFILLILIVQFGGPIFNTIPLSITTWLKIIGLSFSVIVISEISKTIWRLTEKRK